jgi:hypothetical protein
VAVDSGKGLPIERAIKYPEDRRSAIVKLGYVLECSFIAVGVRLLRLVSLIVTTFGAFVSMGVLGASLLSFDKLKMVMLLNCPLRDVYIPLFGVVMDVGMAHNLTMVAAISSLLLLPVSCLALGYLVGRSR